MKNLGKMLPLMLLLTFLFAACEKDEVESKGTINLSITDAPIDADGIEGVYITVTGVHYNTSGSDWNEFDFEGPQTYNLLDLQRGASEMLGSFELEAGTYTQLRFMLDAPISGEGSQSSPGCYLAFEDGTTENLFVPSGGQTGYKAVGTFDVPVNGTVSVTADFDARKSVVLAGASGKYILKPTIRLIVNDQAGAIAGQVSNIAEGVGVVIYAYEDGTYDASEAVAPEAEETRFPLAVTSDMVDEINGYHLAYLAPAMYDLVVVSTIEGEFSQVLGILEDVEVISTEVTNAPIDISTF